MKLWIKRGIAVVLVIGIGAAFYFSMREKPIMVDSTTASVAPMKVTIDADGVTRVRDVYTISSPIAGHLDRSTLDEGQKVKAGKTIVAAIHPLDPPFLDQRTQSELTAAIAAAHSRVVVSEAEMDSARSALTLATSEYQRSAKLVDTRLITESAMDHAYNEVQLKKAQLASARAMVQLRNAELASAEARLIQPRDINTSPQSEDCCVHLTAPIDGVVLTVSTRSEQAVVAGTRIAEVGNPEELEVAVDLISSDAARIQPGSTADIIEWGGETTFSATVRRIEPSAFTKVSSLGIEEQRVNVILDIDDAPTVLGHNYRVVVRLVIWAADKVLQVPIGALFRSQGQWAVFVIEDGVARLRNIGVNHMNDSHAEVTDGLLTDETVILYPNDVLDDGSAVKTRKQ